VIAAAERVDALLFRAERAVVAALLLLMGTFVFFDVVHRVSTRAGSWLANPVVVGVGAAVLGMLALRTRGSGRWHVGGVGVGLAVVAAQWTFIKLVPNGLVWSQTLAMACTLWLGMIGACLAAHDRRHLALDVGSKLWPKAIVHRVVALGHAVTAAFCLGLLYLSAISVSDHYEIWSDSGGAADTLPALPVPKFAVFLAIPLGLAVLTFRFALQAAMTWTGAEAVGGDDTLRQLGIEEAPQ
jgi:TRAP-type C4-dicarboxylate transport system permease small subunit